MSRLVYLDESGTGDVKKEPHLVVAGFIIDPDRDWKRVHERLEQLAQVFMPHLDPSEVVFHANEMLRGSGKAWCADSIKHERRRELLAELCSVLKEFDLPLVTGYIDRERAATGLPRETKANLVLFSHTAAYIRCAVNVERFMRNVAAPDEVATIVHENTHQAKGLIKHAHKQLRKERGGLDVGHRLQEWALAKYLPTGRIAESTLFAEKADSRLLQLADVTAFVVRRYLAGKRDAAELLQLFRSQLTTSDQFLA